MTILEEAYQLVREWQDADKTQLCFGYGCLDPSHSLLVEKIVALVQSHATSAQKAEQDRQEFLDQSMKIVQDIRQQVEYIRLSREAT